MQPITRRDINMPEEIVLVETEKKRRRTPAQRSIAPRRSYFELFENKEKIEPTVAGTEFEYVEPTPPVEAPAPASPAVYTEMPALFSFGSSAPPSTDESSAPYAQTAESAQPTLSSMNVRHVPRINVIQPPTAVEVNTTAAKRNLLFKIDNLRSAYGDDAVKRLVGFDMLSDYDEVQREYDFTFKRLAVDRSVDEYQSYLNIAFVAIEQLVNKYTPFDMTGYAAEQHANRNTYRRLLIELGEKSYIPENSNVPVELRLLMVVVTSAATFIAMKYVSKRVGTGFMDGFVGVAQKMQESTSTKMEEP